MKISFFHWSLELEEGMKPYVDTERKRCAILPHTDDDIHMILELNELGELVMSPRWNVKVTHTGLHKIKVETNSHNE